MVTDNDAGAVTAGPAGKESSDHSLLRRFRRGSQDAATQLYLRHAHPVLALLQLAIDEALEKLPPLHRTMVELRIRGHEIAEIAEQVGRSKRTVERNLQDTRKKLRQFLDDEGAHEVANV